MKLFEQPVDLQKTIEDAFEHSKVCQGQWQQACWCWRVDPSSTRWSKWWSNLSHRWSDLRFIVMKQVELFNSTPATLDLLLPTPEIERGSPVRAESQVPRKRIGESLQTLRHPTSEVGVLTKCDFGYFGLNWNKIGLCWASRGQCCRIWGLHCLLILKANWQLPPKTLNRGYKKNVRSSKLEPPGEPQAVADMGFLERTNRWTKCEVVWDAQEVSHSLFFGSTFWMCMNAAWRWKAHVIPFPSQWLGRPSLLKETPSQAWSWVAL